MHPGATDGAKQNSALQGSRVIIIYKIHMHTGAVIDPERGAFKTDAETRSNWTMKHIQQVDQHEDCLSPPYQTWGDEAMEEDRTT